MDLVLVESHFMLISRLYTSNSIRKNYFIAACKSIDSSVSIEDVEHDRPFGGVIGIGNSKCDKVFHHFKLFRLHAIFHDAAGYMKETHNKGPGYCYAVPCSTFNSCIMGHVSGLCYCIYLKFFNPLYNLLDF